MRQAQNSFDSNFEGIFMKMNLAGIAALATVLLFLSAARSAPPPPTTQPSWSMNATIIEACSCPMFCQCYFDTKPAGHAKDAHAGHEGHEGHQHGEGAEVEHYCKFNNAYKVNHGNYGDTKLDGAKFWMAG